MNGEYYYRVAMTTDYLNVTTTVSLMLDEHTGNLSETAREQAIVEADASIEYEFGRKLSARANDVTVTLLLDDEEVELDDYALSV
jgi:hypothetical protein